MVIKNTLLIVIETLVLRLSRDGITEISNYGMVDFFRDKLSLVGTTGKIIGSYDIYNKNYVVSLQENNGNYNTLGFEESTNGWISFYDYKPSSGFSSQGKFFTTNGTSVWKHYSTRLLIEVILRTVISLLLKLILNPDPTRVKTFKTIDYEGTNGWEVISLVSDETGTDLVNGVWVNNSEQGTSTADPATFTLTNPGSGFYVTGNNVGTSSDGFGVGMKVNIVGSGGGGVTQISILILDLDINQEMFKQY